VSSLNREKLNIREKREERRERVRMGEKGR
jgi:hypothetical protein